MRLLWIFLSVGCLLSGSHALLEDSIQKSGIQSEGGDTGLVNDNGGESINLGDGSGTFPAFMTVTSPVEVPEITTVSVGELDQPEMNIPGGLDTSDITSQLPTSGLNQDMLAQEGLLSTVILNSQDLLTEREKLQTLLLGGRVSFGVNNDLLDAAGTNAVEGLICKGPLGGLCGHGSLSGMNDALKTMNSGELDSRLNVTRFDIVQLSWKVLASSDFEIKFQTKLTINFPGILSFLSGSTVDMDIEIPLQLQQMEPGQMSFSVKSCRAVFTGIQVNSGVISKMMESMLKWSLNISLPNMLCPVARFWFYIINQQLAILQNIASLGMPGDSNLLDAKQPMLYERTYTMDFKNKTFPASFINWLFKTPSS
uniref:BPI fold containing family A, member 6 n=1 Tax=Mus spicilegus TaxID=10103 RepID=A0A8C6HJC7_MUSSI